MSANNLIQNQNCIRILAALPATSKELQKRLGLTSSVSRWLLLLAGTGHVHIIGRTQETFRNGTKGLPIYAIGPNLDLSQLPKVPNWKTKGKPKRLVKEKSVRPIVTRTIPKCDTLNALFGRF